MFAKRIIPCLDIAEGRVVKGTNFVNLRDVGDPIALATQYAEQGADEIVFLDITASSDKRSILIDLVKRCAAELFIPFTVGGGIGDVETIREVLKAGADKVSINTAAVTKPDLIRNSSRQCGSQCIVAAIDARRVTSETSFQFNPYSVVPDVLLTSESHWEVFTHGGRNATGIDAIKWASYLWQLGAGEILLTSMDADGTKDGYDIALTHLVSDTVGIPVIASGGAGNVMHITDVLKGCEAALLASLLHFGTLTIPEIKAACQSAHIPVRCIMP
jgi:cyclase